MKSLNLITFTACLAVLTAPAFAATNTAKRGDITPLSGPYIGVYGGYDWTDLDTAGTSPNLHGWDGGVFVGYKLDALLGFGKNIGIGANGAIEAFYGMSNSDDSVGGFGVEKDKEWGVSLRPGISLFDNVIKGDAVNPYGVLGYRNTKSESSSAALGGSEWYDGFELGIGNEFIASGNIGMRLEYTHVWYASENGIDPDTDNVRLGLSYHF